MNRKTFLKLAAAASFIPLLSIGGDAVEKPKQNLQKVELIRDAVFVIDVPLSDSFFFGCKNKNVLFNRHLAYSFQDGDATGHLSIVKIVDTLSQPYPSCGYFDKDPGTYITRSSKKEIYHSKVLGVHVINWGNGTDILIFY